MLPNEPDESEVSAVLLQGIFDNATGNPNVEWEMSEHPTPVARRAFPESAVVLTYENRPVAVVNLAVLFALAASS